MTWFNRFGTLLIAAAALASACSVNEAGNIPCGDNTNCPPAYPTCGSQGVCVASAAAAKLEVVTGDKQSAISGSQLGAPLVVRVLDTNGNPVQGFTIAWSASAAGSVSVASTTTGPDGKAQVLGTIAKKNGTTTFTATATGLTGSPLSLTAAGVSGPAAKLVGVAGANQTAVAGTALPVPLSVLVTDVNDNPVVGATVTWSATTGGGSIAASATTIADGTATTVALLGTVVGSNAYLASASNGGTSLSGSPLAFSATGVAGVAAQFVLNGPSATVAGVVQNYTLTARDSNGNVAVGYRGTATVSSNDSNAALPAAHAFTATDAGVLHFNATLKTAGTRSVTAVDGSLSASLPSIAVSPAAAVSITVAGFPNSVGAGVPGTVLVTVKDFFGNTASGYRGTVHFNSDNASKVLPSDHIFTAGDLGSKAFSVTLNTASATGSFLISVTDTLDVTITGSQTGIHVDPAPAVSLSVTPSASSTVAGVALASVIVTAKDTFGNTATGYAGTVHFTSSDSQATASLPADSALPGGTQSFSGITFKTAGAQTITAKDIAPSSTITGTSSITVTAATTAAFIVSAQGSTQTAGAPFNLVVTAKDIYGNSTGAAYTGVVQFTSSDPLATPGNGLPADTTLVSGTATLLTTLKTAGTQTVTATDGGITGTSGSVTVNPAGTTGFTVAASTPQTAGVSFSVTVTAKDNFGNTTPSYSGTVQFVSTDGAFVPPTSSTLTSGTKVFAGAILKTAGTQTVTAQDSSIPGTLHGVTGSITVNPASASTLVLTTGAGSPQTAGVAFDVTVTAKDPFGNVATGYGGTVHFTSTDGTATAGAGLPANSTLTSGTKTFTAGATLKTAGVQTITATDAPNSINGTSASITVSPGATSKLVISTHPNSVVAGFANSITVTAEDAVSNVTPAYAGTIQFSTNNTGTLPPNYQFVPGTDNGIHTFVGGVTLTTAPVASATISVTDGTFTTTQNSITVVPAPLFFQGTATLIVGGSRAGQIFIAGGTSVVDTNANATSNTYFYNPATGGMLPGPSMQVARYAHTATATTGGQVIIAGGSYLKVGPTDHYEFENCNTDNTASCSEVSGSPVGPARDAVRCNAAAALLTSSPSFRVVIGGGDDCAGGAAMQSVDVWDSASPTTTVSLTTGTHQLTIGRHLHTATVVASGVVLFAGGATTPTADLFTNSGSIATSTVAATSGGMSIIRTGHTATLVTGTPACPAGPCVLIAGGNSTAGKTWEIYDQTTKTFPRGSSSGATDLLVPGRKQHVAASFSDNKIQLAGGTDGVTDQKSTEVFNPAMQTWGASPDMLITRNRPAGAYASGQNLLIVVGGNLSTPAAEQTTAP